MRAVPCILFALHSDTVLELLLCRSIWHLSVQGDYSRLVHPGTVESCIAAFCVNLFALIDFAFVRLNTLLISHLSNVLAVFQIRIRWDGDDEALETTRTLVNDGRKYS